MANPVSVKWFTSAMSGAPVLTGEANKLIGVLNACLLANDAGGGFGSVTLTSLVVTSGVATATVSAGHNFLTYVVVLIGGATPSGLNGDQRITVVNSTTFTFDATGISNQTATGTITAKMSGVGWVKPFSGTNKAAYARSAAGATAMLLRVDDSATSYASLLMYETMSDIDTGMGRGPVSGNRYYCKSSLTDSTARAWRLFADGACFYLFGKNTDGTYFYAAMDFGDLGAYKSGDGYHCQLHAASSQTAYYAYYELSTWAGVLARSYTQAGSALASGAYSHGKSTTLGAFGQAYPSPVDGCFQAWPVEVWEGTSVARGMMPGLWNPIHVAPSSSGPPDSTLVTSIPQLSGRTLYVQALYNAAAACAIDLTGPWR
jgi:hypothetical protein